MNAGNIITVNYHKVQEGYLAQCPDHPDFLVQVEKKSQIKERIRAIIEGHVHAFPEDRNAVLPNGSMDFEMTLRSEYEET